MISRELCWGIILLYCSLLRTMAAGYLVVMVIFCWCLFEFCQTKAKKVLCSRRVFSFLVGFNESSGKLFLWVRNSHQRTDANFVRLVRLNKSRVRVTNHSHHSSEGKIRVRDFLVHFSFWRLFRNWFIASLSLRNCIPLLLRILCAWPKTHNDSKGVHHL